MRDPLRSVTALVHQIPNEIAICINRWLLRQHMPETLDGEPWCVSFAHRTPKPWPCTEFLDADHRIDQILDRR